MNAPKPRGLTQGVPLAALEGPEDLARTHGLPTLLRLGSNESPFGPSPKALAALAQENARSNRYGDPSAFELREAIAAHHGVQRANVTVGAGIDDLLGWIVRAYVAPGGCTYASLGAFPTFEMHAVGYETALERIPYRPSGRIDLAGIVEAVTRRGPGLVFIPNPDNPSGSTIPWSEVLAFVDALPAGSLVIHDEAYANFLAPEARFPKAALDPRLIRLRTFSKEYGLAGLRVAYALAMPGAIEALDALRLLYGVSRPAQAAAIASLADPEFVNDVARRVAEGRADYAQLGERLGLPTLPSATNFVLFDFGDVARAKQAVGDLLGAGIHVRKPSAPPLDRYVRISVGLPQERVRLAEVLVALRSGRPA